MVDFSDREEIRRWLNRIRPAARRREVATALAARAALRVMPLLGGELRQGKSPRVTNLSDFVLPSLRAAALPWAAARYPAHGSELRAAARAAADVESLFAAAFDAALASDSVFAASTAAYAAAAAATYAARAATAAGASDSVFAASTAVAPALAAGFAADFAAARAADVEAIEAGRSGAAVTAMPLWPNGVPYWANGAWLSLRAALLAANEGWEVWTDWYEARLAGDAGRPPNEALEIARAKIADQIWKQGPAAVNAEIKRLIAEHTSLEQRPAAFRFRVVDDKIDALPDDARPIDPEDARGLYDEAKRKGLILKDRLQRVQADETIRAHGDLLLTRLGNSYSEMRPGLMLSVLRSLESDVRAYDSEEGRKELSAALLSNILDLAETVRDLCAIFPRSREIEAEAVSLGLPMERMPEIRSAIGDVIEKVKASDGATEGGREAINASAADLAHQRDLAQEAKQSAYFLVDFANFTRAGLKHLKTTGKAIGHELGGLGADSWRAFRRGAPKGIERGAARAGKAVIVGGVAALMHALGSDIAALGSVVAAYAPLSQILERLSGAPSETPAPNSASVDEDADSTPPRPPAPQKQPRRPAAKASARKRTES